MHFSRRQLVTAGAAAIAGAGAGLWAALRPEHAYELAIPAGRPALEKGTAGMPYRRFGKTDLMVSEVGFGGWPIGGDSYGAVERSQALEALARAEELGCNFVDTALVYGDSEVLLGEFLRGRRSKWIVATKFSGQPDGMTRTLEQQLRRLGTDAVDLYQLHWVARDDSADLYAELAKLKSAGKARYIGVSLYSAADIDYALERHLDAIQIAFSLLDPLPYLARRDRLLAAGPGVIVRSSLKEGFLAGKFQRDAKFTAAGDQRGKWSAQQIAATVDQVERFRFLEQEAGSMVSAAVRYPLSYPEVSVVILGTKSAGYADANFGQAPGTLPAAALRRVAATQSELGLFGRRQALASRVARWFSRS